MGCSICKKISIKKWYGQTFRWFQRFDMYDYLGPMSLLFFKFRRKFRQKIAVFHNQIMQNFDHQIVFFFFFEKTANFFGRKLSKIIVIVTSTPAPTSVFAEVKIAKF
jgi:hypothetical protein